MQSYWDEFERPQTQITKLWWWLLASDPLEYLSARHREFFPSAHHQWTKTTGGHSSWEGFANYSSINGIRYKPRQCSVSAMISILLPGSVEDTQKETFRLLTLVVLVP